MGPSATGQPAGSTTHHGSPIPPVAQVLSAEGDLITPLEHKMEEGSSSEEKENEYGEQAKSAFYDYASEKSLSHEESKLFYQHTREARQHDPEFCGHLSRARTFSLSYEGRAPRRRFRSGGYYDLMPGRERGLGAPQPYASSRKATRAVLTEDLTQERRSYGDHATAAGILDGSQGVDEDKSPAQIDQPLLDDPGIHPELQEMSSMIQRVLDLRHKYMEISLQQSGDNPKDHSDWKVYPEPPKPVWAEDTTASSATISRATSNALFGAEQDLSMSRSQASLASVAEEPVRLRPASPPRKQRKPGQDIGSDFDMSYFDPLPSEDSTMVFGLDQGSIYQVYENGEALRNKRPWVQVPTLRDFFMDLNIVKEVSEDGPIKSFAFRELQILDGKFNLYTLENSYAEMIKSKGVPHRDFYNVRKVDTHVHHSACMNSKHLLRFIKCKLKKSASDVVMFRDGKEMTLQDVFDSLDMTAYDLSIDTLDTHVSAPWTILGWMGSELTFLGAY